MKCWREYSVGTDGQDAIVNHRWCNLRGEWYLYVRIGTTFQLSPTSDKWESEAAVPLSSSLIYHRREDIRVVIISAHKCVAPTVVVATKCSLRSWVPLHTSQFQIAQVLHLKYRNQVHRTNSIVAQYLLRRKTSHQISSHPIHPNHKTPITIHATAMPTVG